MLPHPLAGPIDHDTTAEMNDHTPEARAKSTLLLKHLAACCVMMKKKPASSFRTSPAPRKPSIDPALEMGVPAYALPGTEVWAMGLHAGSYPHEGSNLGLAARC